MAYSTQANMINRFSEQELIDLTDEADKGVIDQAVLTAAIADADAEIDGYLSSVYVTPIAGTVPIDVVRISCDIARYRLYNDKAPEEIRQRYEDARAWLRDVAAGKVRLAIAKPTTTTGFPLTVAIERA
jgi:phage gp36-like protein